MLTASLLLVALLPDLGPHAAFIWACYGAVGGVLMGLAAWLILDGRRLERRLSEIEARDPRRRNRP